MIVLLNELILSIPHTWSVNESSAYWRAEVSDRILIVENN